MAATNKGKGPFEKLKGSIRSCIDGLKRWSRALRRNINKEITVLAWNSLDPCGYIINSY